MSSSRYGRSSRYNQRGSSSEEERLDDDTASWRQYVDTPDRSKGDYRCRICTAHMSSVEMWDAHVIGKKHLKNIKKGPGEAPSKVKTIPCNEPPTILPDILDTDLPIIGLKYVCETKRADRKVAPFYSCYLCHATCTTTSILDHIVSTKHRMNYFEKNVPSLYDLICDMPLSKMQLDSVVEDHAINIEKEHGRGRIEVRTEKPKGTPFSFSRMSSTYRYKSSQDDARPKPEPGPSRESPSPPPSTVYGPSPPPPIQPATIPVARRSSHTPPAGTSRSSHTPPANASRSSHTPPAAASTSSHTPPPAATSRSTPTPPVAASRNTHTPPAAASRSTHTPPATTSRSTHTPPATTSRSSLTPPAALTAADEAAADPCGYVKKNLENANEDELENILRMTKEMLQSMSDDDPQKFETLRQYTRIINTIGMHQHYNSLPPEKQRKFVSLLNNREECLRRLRGGD